MALAGGATTVRFTPIWVLPTVRSESSKSGASDRLAIALDPEFAAAHLNYAWCCGSGIAATGCGSFEIVLELGEDSPSEFLSRADPPDEDQPALAADKLRAALRLQPDHAEAHYSSRGRCCLGDTAPRACVATALNCRRVRLRLSRLQAGFELCHETQLCLLMRPAQPRFAGRFNRLRAARAAGTDRPVVRRRRPRYTAARPHGCDCAPWRC